MLRDVAVAHPLGPQRLDRLSEQLVARVTEQLLGERVHEHDLPVARGGDDGVG